MTNQEPPKRLNLGCGNDIRPGFVNLDVVALPGVDVVHDLGILPLPFDSGRFEHVVCRDILEHLEYLPLLAEIHRVLAPGGTVRVRVPHFSARINYIDPTHIKRFSFRTFDFFDAELSKNWNSHCTDVRFARIVRRRITFKKRWWMLPFNAPMYLLVNLAPTIQDIFEQTFWCRLFPAQNIDVELQK